MTDADCETLLALASRCEQEGPSRELDCRIAFAVLGNIGIGTKGPLNCPQTYFLSEAIQHPGDLRQIAADDDIDMVPRYTESLSEAVALRGEHISYELTYSAAGEGALRRCRAWDWRRSATGFDPGNEWKGEGKTLESAACAAFLRARAA